MRDMVLSSLFFAVMAAVAKIVGERVPMQQIVLVRGVLCALLTYWWLVSAGVSWRGQRPGILLLRGALGYAALSCYFWSVHHLPLAEAILIQQTHPVFAAALAWLFLREPPGRRFAPALALAIAGVAVLVRPGAEGSFVGGWGVLVALSGAMLSAGAYVAVRDASRTEHPMALVFWFPAVSAVLAVPGTAAAGPVWPGAGEWAGLLFVALSGQLGQVFLTRGLYRVPAGRATLANPLTTFFGAFLGWAVFGERLGWPTLAGGLLLVAAVLLAGAPAGRPARVETLSSG
jgi:drug/metabolite transporter (DMT)-like permease